RPSKVTSYSNNNGTGTVENENEYYFHNTGKLTYLWQSHQGAVDGSSPLVSFGYDTSVVSNVYDDGLRHVLTGYYQGTTGTSSVTLAYSGTTNDRLHRIGGMIYENQDDLDGTHITTYSYTGG